MQTTELIAAIDTEIAQLQTARNLLAGVEARNGAKAPNRRGERRTMSTEARARIAAAQRKRWAAKKATKR